MYSFPYFKEPDHEKVLNFMRLHPFALIAGCDLQHRPVATQVPMFIDTRDDGSLVLTGHLQKKTGHHLAFVENPQVMAVFTGPNCHVSASWYTNPLQGSTWNYMTVQAAGTIRFTEGPALLELLRRTTTHFENNAASPSLVEHLPKEYVDGMMKAIAAFEIEVTSLEHVFKLSQNRDAESYAAIIAKLEAKGGDAALIAQQMRQRQEELFGAQGEG